MTPTEAVITLIPFTLIILFIGYKFGKLRTERRFSREVNK